MRTEGVKFGEYHTYKQWKLKLKKVVIGMPEAKTILIDIPGGDGVLDLSNLLTKNTQYKERLLEFYFNATGSSYEDWISLISDISCKVHGNRMRIILDIDPFYYYDGLVEVETEKNNSVTSQIVFKCKCQPYKLELTSSLEDWVWDTFNFDVGIIREYKDIEIQGEREVIIPGSKKEVVPTFIVEAEEGLKLNFNGVLYNLSNGSNRILTLVIEEGENTLVFTGNGKVSVDYTGGML